MTDLVKIKNFVDEYFYDSTAVIQAQIDGNEFDANDFVKNEFKDRGIEFNYQNVFELCRLYCLKQAEEENNYEIYNKYFLEDAQLDRELNDPDE